MNTGVERTYDRCYTATTKISEQDIEACRDKRIILPMVQMELARRIADLIMDQLSPTLQRILTPEAK
jgi:hypothetical protein